MEDGQRPFLGSLEEGVGEDSWIRGRSDREDTWFDGGDLGSTPESEGGYAEDTGSEPWILRRMHVVKGREQRRTYESEGRGLRESPGSQGGLWEDTWVYRKCWEERLPRSEGSRLVCAPLCLR